MEEDLKKLDALFDSILDEIIHPEKAGAYRNPFIDENTGTIAELAESVTVVLVTIADDCMTAVANVMATGIKHKPFTSDDILRAASSAGVFYGIDEDAISEMVADQVINTDVTIAWGTAPVAGVDGKLHVRYEIDEGGEIPNIEKDTEICHIINPKQGRDGKDVRGRVVAAQSGKASDFRIGEGMYKKGTRVYAEYTGKLILRGGIYSIVNEMVLDKNIDQSSGIIGFEGTIIINGNVTGRAVVRAGRSVIIHGALGGSVIEAVKDVQVDGRVTDSSISADEGDITGGDFFDSTLVSGGKITAASLNNCTAKCIGGIECLTGHGKISGGEVYCAGDIKCLSVGTREHTETHLILGDHTEFSEEIKTLELRVQRLDSEISKINDQVNEIREREKNGTATLEEESFLDAAIRIRSQKASEKAPMQERIKKLSGIVADADKATLHVKNMLYGGTFLKISGHTQILNSDRSHATARASGNNIVIT